MPEDTVLMPKTKRRRPSPRQLRSLAKMLVIVAAIVLLAAGGIWLSQSVFAGKPCSKLEKGSLLDRGIYLLHPASPGEVEQLGVLAEEIRDSRSYDKDPNCLHILTHYYITVSEPENARFYADKLAVGDNIHNINPELFHYGVPPTLEEIYATIDNIEKISQEFEENNPTLYLDGDDNE